MLLKEGFSQEGFSQQGLQPTHLILQGVLPNEPVLQGVKPTESVLETTEQGNHIDDGESLPRPAVVLFPEEQLDHSWKHPAGGAGLENWGNTCFLNAVVQCLVHTPPLTNYLMSDHHNKHCKEYPDTCILCNMQLIMKDSLNSPTDSFSPKWFINNLQLIGRHLRNGQQEDAHEFLRLSLEQMQNCALVGADHDVINQIFGGVLRSQVICLNCGARSNTYDPVLDISLNIESVENIEQAFQMFVAPDRLDNTYKCEKFQYEETNVFGGGGKISKFVHYPARLNLRPYMSNKNGPPEMYSLFASIQHEGFSCQSGHYVANVRCGKKWYHFNDSMKQRTSLHECLSESSAYVLFYIKDLSPPAVSPSSPPRFKSQTEQKTKQSGTTSATASKFIGPVKPQVIKTPEKPSSTRTITNHNGIQSNGIKKPVSSLVAPLAEREKIPFSFDDDEIIAKPRQKKLSKKSRLVPYADNSSSDSDLSGKQATATTNGHGRKLRNGDVFDPRLNATTSVTGNTHLYETVTVKDKINHHCYTATDSKPPSTKASMSTPLKRKFSETPTCVTNPTPSKNARGAEWHTSDAMLSPSICSLSSAHSNNSTSDWLVSNDDKPHSSGSSDRVHEGWTVTPGKYDMEMSISSGDTSSKNDHTVSGKIAERKEHVGSWKSLTNLKRQVMQEQMRPDDLLADVASPSPSDKACLLDTDLAKDSQRRSSSGYTTPVKSHSWDGLKTSKVVSQLEKLQEYDYCAPVSSWDGQRSQMDAARNIQERLARKRSLSGDDHDKEFDRGKVKRVKQQYIFDARFNGNILQDRTGGITAHNRPNLSPCHMPSRTSCGHPSQPASAVGSQVQDGNHAQQVVVTGMQPAPPSPRPAKRCKRRHAAPT